MILLETEASSFRESLRRSTFWMNGLFFVKGDWGGVMAIDHNSTQNSTCLPRHFSLSRPINNVTCYLTSKEKGHVSLILAFSWWKRGYLRFFVKGRMIDLDVFPRHFDGKTRYEEEEEEEEVHLARNKKSRADETDAIPVEKAVSRFEGVIKDSATEALVFLKKSHKRWQAHYRSLKEDPLPMHLEMPNFEGILKEYSHMDQFAVAVTIHLRVRRLWSKRMMSF
ncbi:hypothetical protein LWI29_003080 [Acer saccharum]|uniref:Uncharacterized protein n=1 Tax=Acer saccharum TaxID=4024 RepID=A0AA39VD48_ACESA|nr:hypothetical protein LWI29_003080 [Acer saccharum]